MLNTIFFDLDGTLVPFMQDEFVHAYFGKLAKKLAPFGYEKDRLVETMWKGFAAMVKNDGSSTNKEVFWKIFSQSFGEIASETEEELENFYKTDFDTVRSVLVKQVNRKPIIKMLREKGYGVVLATNPVFPVAAVEARMQWVGLTGSDFDYVTTYENSIHSKPNPEYYKDILKRIGKEGEECLMIGNHPVEDMIASEAGLSTYLVTDCIENPDNLPLDAFRHGTFEELEGYLKELQAVDLII